MMQTTTYDSFLSSITRPHWQRIGLVRRAGVCTPLFSLHSQKSLGIGELPDLKLLVDWCRKTGISIIQLLPMNDTGFSFQPYDAQSTFALDAVYLRLPDLPEFKNEIEKLRQDFPPGQARVNYGVKKAKLELLWRIFSRGESPTRPYTRFQEYINQNAFWLEDYALFKVLKFRFNESSWEAWEPAFRNKEVQAIERFKQENVMELQFQRWLQWQLYKQFKDVKKYARAKKVFLMGDLPFLVARDSADVWAHQNYFKLDFSSGAPPDAFFAMGQRWGMPPYQWEAIEQKGYDYLIEKVRYAENFYDMFRIDHVVGTFRLWTIPNSEPLETQGLKGHFDPSNEAEWEDHGRKLLSVMIENSAMLPCAEDLGVVPECSYRTLKDFAIPGMEVQRWTKEWNTDGSFKAPEKYRPNAMAVISNHDMTSFHGWWTFEAGTVDEELFRRRCQEQKLDFEALKSHYFDLSQSSRGRLRWKAGIREDEVGSFAEMHRGSYDEKNRFWHYVGLEGPAEEAPSPKLLKAAMEKASQSAAIFNVQLLQDLLDLGPLFAHDAWDFRINFPGTTGPHNWTLVMPVSLEALGASHINTEIKKINEMGDRVI